MNGKLESCKMVTEPRREHRLVAPYQKRVSVLGAPEARPGDHFLRGWSDSAEETEAADSTWFLNVMSRPRPEVGDPRAPKAGTVLRNPLLGPSPPWTLQVL